MKSRLAQALRIKVITMIKMHIGADAFSSALLGSWIKTQN